MRPPFLIDRDEQRPRVERGRIVHRRQVAGVAPLGRAGPGRPRIQDALEQAHLVGVHGDRPVGLGVELFAHRGGAAAGFENSLAAFAGAVDGDDVRPRLLAAIDRALET